MNRWIVPIVSGAVLIAILGTPISPLAAQHAYARASVMIAVVSALAGVAGLVLLPARQSAARVAPSPEAAPAMARSV